MHEDLRSQLKKYTNDEEATDGSPAPSTAAVDSNIHYRTGQAASERGVSWVCSTSSLVVEIAVAGPVYERERCAAAIDTAIRQVATVVSAVAHGFNEYQKLADRPVQLSVRVVRR